MWVHGHGGSIPQRQCVQFEVTKGSPSLLAGDRSVCPKDKVRRACLFLVISLVFFLLPSRDTLPRNPNTRIVKDVDEAQRPIKGGRTIAHIVRLTCARRRPGANLQSETFVARL